MKLPRARFTVRLLMVVVAFSGGLLGAERLRENSVTLGTIARFHAGEERRHLASIQSEKSGYFSRCQRLNEHGIPLSRPEIEAGLADAWARWPELRRIGIDPNYNECKMGVPNGYGVRLAWDLGTASELAAHHEKLRRKYERAARYPWLPVEPDPPEPD